MKNDRRGDDETKTNPRMNKVNKRETKTNFAVIVDTCEQFCSSLELA